MVNKKEIQSKADFGSNVIAVPDSVYAIWKEKQTRGDVKKLVTYTRKSKPVIIRALNKQMASVELILKISTYFSHKPDAGQQVEQIALQILRKKV
ncbi:hypothetical protein QTN47_15270 [Danxiaibacter flavus]|uniref:Uncharacterized protein n=1 Tax=Danxiaibacter flavus TaxID=3049108 RepID=A0ABV3ZG98_9BACT|nr:hypothetical protein QNM32_15280 [Chitinophagaceae bacterium DXS]